MLRKKLEISTLTEFNCTGNKCPLTCCVTTWGISLTDKEIEAYKSIKHPFKEEIVAAIDKEKKRFKGDENDRCRMLTKEGLCKIVLKFGDKALSTTCRYFPREMYINGDIYEAGAEVACPVVAERLFEDKLPYFTYDEEEIDGEVPENTDYTMYDSLSEIRNFIIDLLLSGEPEDVYGKVFIIIDIVTGIKNLIKEGSLNSESSAVLLSRYNNDELISKICEGMREVKCKSCLTEALLFKVLGAHSDMMREIMLQFVVRFKEIDINKCFSDTKLFMEGVNGLIDFTRKNCPAFLRNFLINKIFLFFIPKEDEKFGDRIFQIFNELFLIQLFAAASYAQNGGITLEEYSVIVAKTDRMTVHFEKVGEFLNKMNEKLSAKDFIDMLMF